jgi:hypothetical protein
MIILNYHNAIDEDSTILIILPENRIMRESAHKKGGRKAIHSFYSLNWTIYAGVSIEHFGKSVSKEKWRI